MSDALFEALMRGNVSEVSALLEAGASVNECNEDGQTPLAIAALKDELEIVNLLLVKGANPNHGSDLDEMDARIRFVEAALSRAQGVFMDGGLMDTPPCSGSTPLFHAALAGSNRVALRLIESGTDVNRVSDDLKTALRYAVMGGGRRNR